MPKTTKPRKAKAPKKAAASKTAPAKPSPRTASAKPRATGAAAAPAGGTNRIPLNVNDATINVSGGDVHLSNLNKIFFPQLKLTKRDLLQYYLDVSPWLLPHIQNRAMVMKRYPNGITGEFFFMKRAPSPRPKNIPICSIKHHSGNTIDFPVVQNVATLLWVINLGCIDLNPWYARCDEVDLPDFLHFDLDPTPGANFKRVIETALAVRKELDAIKIPSYAKTTGSRGIHVYVPIQRGPTQKQVWTFAKAFGTEMANRYPALVTSIYKVANRPRDRVLVDYNQNAWNRTLASVYSVRPVPAATVSTPVAWEELERGVKMEDFTIKTVPKRLEKVGDLWKPVLADRGRFDLAKLL
jgi:bifunctional non-homologous end joining protein LigD